MCSVDAGVTFLDFPTELLLHIISSIASLRDILNLSCISRRFHSLALPIFLARHGIRDPERETSIYVLDWNPSQTSITNQPDALSGLNSLTTITRVNHFRCFFQDPGGKRNTFQQAFNLPEAVKRVSRFVQRLKHVGTAEIYLMWDPYFVSRERTITHVTGYVPISEIRRWINSFGYLLNLLVVRGCTSLTVQFDPTIDPPVHFRSVNPVKKAVSYLSQNVLRREGRYPELQWEFERLTPEDKSSNEEVETPVLPSLGQGFNCITSLFIHSPILLLPPFTNWTLSLLRSHPHLTSISFAYISFSSDIWATILPLIATVISDKVTELSFVKNCPNLDAVDLLHFISQCPKLRYLSVGRTFRPRLQELKLHKSLFSYSILPSFTQLESLHAPVELVSLLLDARPITKDSAHIALPKLTHLTLYPSSRLIHPPSYIASSIAVNSLLSRVSSQPRAHQVAYALDAQMEFTDFRPVTQYINNLNTKDEFRRSVWETLTQTDIEQLMQDSRIPRIAFFRITHLLLYQFTVRYPDQTPETLCLWIKLLFPNLERLTITCQLEAHPDQDIVMNADVIESLIRELGEACPKVRVLVVGQKTYDL